MSRKSDSHCFFVFFAFFLARLICLPAGLFGLSSETATVREGDLPGPACERPLSLEQCIALSLANNLEIRAQRSSLDAAHHKTKEQFSLAKPRLGAQQIYSLQGRIPGFGEASIGDKETSITQITLTQPIYSFGRLERGKKLVKEEYQAENAQYTAVRADVTHRVIRSFLEVLKNRNRVQIASETVEVLQEHLKLVENLLSAGVVLNTDLSMTKVKVLEVRQGLIEARNEFDIAQIGLRQLIGLPRESLMTFMDIPQMPINASTTRQNTDLQPELASLEHLIKVGEHGYQLAKRNNLPFIGLQAAWSSGNQFFEDFANWNANVVVDFPFFDSGSSRAKKRQVAANLQKLKHMRDGARQKFDLAIDQSARKVQELQEKSALAMQIEATARENYSNLKNQYQQGAAINTDVLEAQLSWSNARSGVNNAYYDYVAFLSDHYRSLGQIDDFIKLVQEAGKSDAKKRDE